MKFKGGLIVLLLCLVLVGGSGIVNATCPEVFEVDKMKGDGTPSNPCQITNWNQFLLIGYDMDAHYILMNDITKGTASHFIKSGIPLGYGTKEFKGTLDGKGHKIKGLDFSSNGYFKGIFEENSGTIKNLGLEGVNIDSNENLVGGLVSINLGKIEKVFVTGTKVKTSSFVVGGIVGENMGEIVNSYSKINIETNSDGGGLVGNNDRGALIKNCFATGDISSEGYSSGFIGGLVGDNSGDVLNCFATGNLEGWISTGAAGGLIGYNQNSGMEDNSYYSGSCNINEGNCNEIGTKVSEAELYNINNEPLKTWDFGSVWEDRFDGVGVPHFQWEGAMIETYCKGYTIDEFPQNSKIPLERHRMDQCEKNYFKGFCDESTDCVYLNICYDSGNSYDFNGDGNKEAYCSKGVWKNSDYSAGICSKAGGVWNVGNGKIDVEDYNVSCCTGMACWFSSLPKCNDNNYCLPSKTQESVECCCGDDKNEYAVSRKCEESVCSSDNNDMSCCDSSSDCVYEGQCYNKGDTSGGVCIVDETFTYNQNACEEASKYDSSIYWDGEECSESSLNCNIYSEYNCPSTNYNFCKVQPSNEIDMSNAKCLRGEWKKIESLCDAGEYYVYDKENPLDYACCASPNNCVKDGVCYSEGPLDLDGDGESESFCTNNKIQENIDGDLSYDNCYSKLGFPSYAWNIGNGDSPTGTENCCGDDEKEYAKLAKCQEMTTICFEDDGSYACCDNDWDCVFNGECYNHESELDLDGDGDNEICLKGTWLDGYLTGNCLGTNTYGCSSYEFDKCPSNTNYCKKQEGECVPTGCYEIDDSYGIEDKEDCNSMSNVGCVWHENYCDERTDCVYGGQCYDSIDLFNPEPEKIIASSGEYYCVQSDFIGINDPYEKCGEAIIGSEFLGPSMESDFWGGISCKTMNSITDCWDIKNSASVSNGTILKADSDEDLDYCDNGIWRDCVTNEHCDEGFICENNDCVVREEEPKEIEMYWGYNEYAKDREEGKYTGKEIELTESAPITELYMIIKNFPQGTYDIGVHKKNTLSFLIGDKFIKNVNADITKDSQAVLVKISKDDLNGIIREGSTGKIYFKIQTNENEFESSDEDYDGEPKYLEIKNSDTIGDCNEIYSCSNYNETGECMGDKCNIANESVEENKGEGFCGNKTFVNKVGCNKTIVCECSWDSSSKECSPASGDVWLSNECTEGNEIPGDENLKIGECRMKENTSADPNGCNDGIMHYEWTGEWAWGNGNSFNTKEECDTNGNDFCIEKNGKWHFDPEKKYQECITTKKTNEVSCPSKLKLPFFSWINVIAVVLVIAVIYYFISRREYELKL